MNGAPTFIVWLKLIGLLAGEIALVVGGGALIQRFTTSAAWRRTLWQVCLLSLLVLPLCELSGTARLGTDWFMGKVVPQVAPVAETSPTRSRAVPFRLDDEFRTQVAQRAAANRQLDQARPAGIQPETSQPPTALPRAIHEAAMPQSAGLPIKPAQTSEDPVFDSMAVLCLGLVWLGGTVLVIARNGFACLLLLVFRRRREVVANATLHARIGELARVLGVGQRVRLVASPGLAGPIVYGLWRPVIALPSDFADRFSTPQQDAMLTHELAHLAARDPFWHLLANWAGAVLWWHPLVWWARRQLHTASEQVADEASLLVADGPVALAECLVMLGARLGHQRSFVWMGVEGSGLRSGLGRRVERLLQLCGSARKSPGRAPTALAKILGPAALLVAVILCTAWIGPRAFTKGESMKTIKQTWSRSLAAVALLASLHEESHSASSPIPKRDNPTFDVAALLQDGRRLYEMGNLNEAESKFKEAVRRAPDNRNAFSYLTLIAESRYAQGAAGQNKATVLEDRAAGKPAASEPVSRPAPRDASRPEMIDHQREMMLRYGMIPPGTSPSAINAANLKERSPIASRLEKIVLDEVKFDGVPLPEVLRWLDEESRKHDPDKHGVNFLINPNVASIPAGQTVDPTTGQVISLPSPEPMDMNSVMVRFNLPLRNVRLKDVLDAIVKVADKAIVYSVEEYGVVFSKNPNPSAGYASAQNPPFVTPPLQVRTFLVDTNTFLAGLKRAFGTDFDPKDNATTEQIRSTLRDVFTRLGIDMDVPGKTVFYNDLTGIVMVRATFEDLEIVKAAIETLGGSGIGQAASPGPTKAGATPFSPNEEMMRRYGLLPRK